jgi:hypothetical protein
MPPTSRSLGDASSSIAPQHAGAPGRAAPGAGNAPAHIAGTGCAARIVAAANHGHFEVFENLVRQAQMTATRRIKSRLDVVGNASRVTPWPSWAAPTSVASDRCC